MRNVKEEQQVQRGKKKTASEKECQGRSTGEATKKKNTTMRRSSARFPLVYLLEQQLREETGKCSFFFFFSCCEYIQELKCVWWTFQELLCETR